MSYDTGYDIRISFKQNNLVRDVATISQPQPLVGLLDCSTR